MLALLLAAAAAASSSSAYVPALCPMSLAVDCTKTKIEPLPAANRHGSEGRKSSEIAPRNHPT